MPAAAVATRAPGSEVPGGEHEQAGGRIDVAVVASGEGGRVGGQDRLPMERVRGKPLGMGLRERSVGQPVHAVTIWPADPASDQSVGTCTCTFSISRAPGVLLACPNDMSEKPDTVRKSDCPAGTSTATPGSSIS